MLNDNENENLQTPLHLAVRIGSIDIVKLLLSQKAKNLKHVTMRDKIGRTPFLYAARHGYLEVLKLLHEVVLFFNHFLIRSKSFDLKGKP